MSTSNKKSSAKKQSTAKKKPTVKKNAKEKDAPSAVVVYANDIQKPALRKRVVAWLLGS
jgi:hypothetical protein